MNLRKRQDELQGTLVKQIALLPASKYAETDQQAIPEKLTDGMG